MTASFSSYGRGGAGNVALASNTAKLTSKDLETPTLKTSVVTTGRGGSGNMAKNSDPYETRLRQDVEGVPRRPSTGATHYGRGGAANVFKPSAADAASAKSGKFESAVDDSASRKSTDAYDGLAAKGKTAIFGKKA